MSPLSLGAEGGGGGGREGERGREMGKEGEERGRVPPLALLVCVPSCTQ